MIKKIFSAVVILVAAFCGYVALQPSQFRVVRATAIDATAPAVFAQVNDFSKWQDWSPWVKLDPNAKTTFEGPSAGQGAMFAWSGNDTVGEGSMLLVESRPNELVKSRTDFKRPFEGTSISEFVSRRRAIRLR